MEKEIKRLKEMLSKEDPRTPNYGTLLANLEKLDYLGGWDYSGDACLCKELVVEEPVAEEPAPKKPAPKKPKAEEPVAEFTIEEVRAAIKEAQAKGVDARPYIAAYGVKNLSGVPKECYGELIEAVGGANA